MFDQDMRTQIAATAKSLNVLPAALLAVVEVESGGRMGAKVNGRMEPMIRFEGHYFHRLLPKALRAIARDQRLAHPRAGNVTNPRHQARRWTKLKQAIKINRIAALSSVSWGVGQVMGSHWQWLGYGSVDVLVQEARSGLSGQVRLMARFIQKSGLVAKLNSQDWAGFARTYNGPGYRKNRYDKKMAAAFSRYQRLLEDQGKIGGDNSGEGEFFRKKPILKMRSRGRAVQFLQRLISDKSNTLLIDGKFGRQTRMAVERFQEGNGLIADGVVGLMTWMQLSRQLKIFTEDPKPDPSKPKPFALFVDFVFKIFRL